MSRRTSLSIVFALSSLSLTASADPMPLGPAGGALLCTPEKDTNHDGVCDWRDTLGTGGGGGVVVANPSGGSIVPDPTLLPGLIYNDVDGRGSFSLWAKSSWDGRSATYVELLAPLPSSTRFSIGLESVDFDGDGSLDVIVGDPASDAVDEDAGAVYIFFGPIADERPRDVREADATIYGSVAGGAFGADIHAIEGEPGLVLLQVNGAREGTVYEFSIGDLPNSAGSENLIELGSSSSK